MRAPTIQHERIIPAISQMSLSSHLSISPHCFRIQCYQISTKVCWLEKEVMDYQGVE